MWVPHHFLMLSLPRSLCLGKIECWSFLKWFGCVHSHAWPSTIAFVQGWSQSFHAFPLSQRSRLAILEEYQLPRWSFLRSHESVQGYGWRVHVPLRRRSRMFVSNQRVCTQKRRIVFFQMLYLSFRYCPQSINQFKLDFHVGCVVEVWECLLDHLCRCLYIKHPNQLSARKRVYSNVPPSVDRVSWTRGQFAHSTASSHRLGGIVWPLAPKYVQWMKHQQPSRTPTLSVVFFSMPLLAYIACLLFQC